MYKYRSFTLITDNGPYITKLLLEAPVELSAVHLSLDLLNVYVERRNISDGELFMSSKTWMGPKIYPSKGYREIRAIYPCDEQGNRTDSSKIIAVEMPYGPSYPLGQSISPSGMMNEYVTCNYRVTQVKEIPGVPPVSGMVFDECAGDICNQTKGWAHGKSSLAALPLAYGYFTPDFEELRKPSAGGPFAPPKKEIPAKVPLVIWLHGAGEGGIDPTIAYTGNKVVAISAPDIQNKLGGAAWVLAPQCPTMWMDNGTGVYTTDGKSKYTEALKACIDEFVELHKAEIDENRIFIGGCSNGGFMTMRMIVDYPTYFAAAYPVCEALYDDVISDTDIENIKTLPIWFTHAANDPVCRPNITIIPTFNRLRAAGGANIHASYFPNIVDATGMYKDDLGRPYEYIGHFAWIHTYNDFCMYDMDGTRVMWGGEPMTLWTWLGLQGK